MGRHIQSYDVSPHGTIFRNLKPQSETKTCYIPGVATMLLAYFMLPLQKEI